MTNCHFYNIDRRTRFGPPGRSWWSPRCRQPGKHPAASRTPRTSRPARKGRHHVCPATSRICSVPANRCGTVFLNLLLCLVGVARGVALEHIWDPCLGEIKSGPGIRMSVRFCKPLFYLLCLRIHVKTHQIRVGENQIQKLKPFLKD
jgi:hypothetical protein